MLQIGCRCGARGGGCDSNSSDTTDQILRDGVKDPMGQKKVSSLILLDKAH